MILKKSLFWKNRSHVTRLRRNAQVLKLAFHNTVIRFVNVRYSQRKSRISIFDLMTMSLNEFDLMRPDCIPGFVISQPLDLNGSLA
jgi:hypothetical protein